jgi:hypothetical protein
MADGEWRPDPDVPGRLRYWDGQIWSSHVSLDGEQFEEPYLGPGRVRWQYGIISFGAFNSQARMSQILASAGAGGWELVAVFDKQSNWINVENGFVLLKRPVQPGARLSEDQWCISLTN